MENKNNKSIIKMYDLYCVKIINIINIPFVINYRDQRI